MAKAFQGERARCVEWDPTEAAPVYGPYWTWMGATGATKHPEEPLGSVNAGSVSKLSRQRSRFRAAPPG